MTDIQSLTQALPPEYTRSIAVDPRGFVRVSGICIGRLLTEDDMRYLEIKDRSGARALARGAQLVRIPIEEIIRGLTQ